MLQYAVTLGMTGPIRLEVQDRVAWITIDRPEKLNALDKETIGELKDAIGEAKDADARVVVFTGGGDDAFVAGADIAYMKDFTTAEAHEYAMLGHDLIDAVESYPGATIAAINGYAFGGGAELALACDLRVASERALIGQTEIDLGIIPGWGGTQRLPALVGDEMARRLIFFGERVDASDAHEIGLVGEVIAHDDLEDHVSDMAQQLADKPAAALAGAKEAINKFHEMPRSAGLDFEARTWAGLFGSHDQREGMEAFLEDREPEFE